MPSIKIPENPFRSKDPKNGFDSVILDGKVWQVIRRLDNNKNPDGFFMRSDIYKIKRKPEGGKTIKKFAVITEMRSGKDDWNYWIEQAFKTEKEAGELLDRIIAKIASQFGVLDQLKAQISKNSK
ncbi:MAG: hypothetical protein KGH71_02435 [Candidatus Micrarchaeota archaeon]|nr:hypothetical protein [Candidatus Micrarchaeota archaeon]